MKNKTLLSILTFILTVGIGFYLGGCGKQAPFAPGMEHSGVSSSAKNLTFVKHSDPGTSLMKIVTVSELVTVQDGGELSLSAGKDPDLLALINQDPPVWPSRLYLSLSNASPLSPTVLQAMIERPTPLYSSYLYSILSMNSPLRECVLQTVIDNAQLLASSYIYSLLLASSPLSSDILDQVGNIGLPAVYVTLILNAQTGVRGSEYAMNTGGGGAMVSLEILPGSVTEDEELSISLDDEDLAGDVFLTFGPHGTVFNPPAILNIEASGLDLSGGDPNTIDIYYDNQETGQWEPMPRADLIVDQNEGYIKVVDAHLPHFSRYAVAFTN